MVKWRNEQTDNVKNFKLSATEFGWNDLDVPKRIQIPSGDWVVKSKNGNVASSQPNNPSDWAVDFPGVGQEAQAIYIIRGYLLFARHGFESAYIYSALNNNESVFGSCGVYDSAPLIEVVNGDNHFKYSHFPNASNFLNEKLVMPAIRKFRRNDLAGNKNYRSALKESDNGVYAYLIGNNTGNPTHMIAWHAANINKKSAAQILSMTTSETLAQIGLPGNLTVDTSKSATRLDWNENSINNITPSSFFNSGTQRLTLNPIPLLIPLTPTTTTTSCQSFGPCQSFESGLGNFVQATDDDINWTQRSGATGSVNTGPSSAADGTQYFYTEASGFSNKKAVLTSPCIELTGISNPVLKFSYHMYGSDMGSLKVTIVNSTTGARNLAFSKSGNQGNQWVNEIIDLSAYSNNDITIEIEGVTGSNYRSDISIDNFCVESAAPVGCLPIAQAFNPCESFETGLGIFEQSTSDDINWTQTSGSTPSNPTGPSAASSGNAYYYTESSGRYGKTAILSSSCFTLSGLSNPVLKFDYHMYGGAMGTLKVYIKAGGSQNLVFNKTGNQGNSWFTETINLSTYLNQDISVIIEGTTGSSYTSDIAIDQFCIEEGSSGVDCSAIAVNVNGSQVTVSNLPGDDQIVKLFRGGSVEDECNSFNGNNCSGTVVLNASQGGAHTIQYQVFESGNLVCNTTVPVTIGATTCPVVGQVLGQCESFESGSSIFTQSASDDIDWTRQSGTTGSGNTGPPGASSGTYYFYTEASQGNANKTAILESSCFKLSGLSNPALEFDYHMWGSTMGTLKVFIKNVASGASSLVFEKSGNQGNAWKSESVDLASFVNDDIRIVIEGKTGNSYTSDISIDNFCIVEASSCIASSAACQYQDGFESGFSTWSNTGSDLMDWSLKTGGTPSGGTGPSSAQSGSNYAYVEASGQFNKTANLEMDCMTVPNSGSVSFDFYYHMYGNNMGSLQVQVSNSPNSWSTLTTLAGNQGNQWKAGSVSLNAYQGQTITIRFKATTGPGYASDIAVDNLSIRCASARLGASVTSPTKIAAPTTSSAPPRAPRAFSKDWPVSLSNWGVFATPLLHDVEGDGAMEIIIAAQDGQLHLLDSAGNAKAGWPQATEPLLRNTPTAGDLNGDGVDEILVGDNAGKLHAWFVSGATVPGFPVSTGSLIKCTPTVIDIDRDASPEIIFQDSDSTLHILHANGTPRAGWPVTLPGTLDRVGTWLQGSSPVVLQADEDADLEIAVGSESGQVIVLNPDGTVLPGWPRTTSGSMITSLLSVELSGGGAPELLASTGDGELHAWHRDGSPVGGFPVTFPANIVGTPAIGDLDGDGDIEIVVADIAGAVHCLGADGTTKTGWPKAPSSGALSSPILVDIDNDGGVDVLVGSKDNHLHAWRADGSPVTGFPTDFGEGITAAAVADTDGDGDLELCLTTFNGSVHLWDLPTPADPGGAL